MKYILGISLLCLAACTFHPLYGSKVMDGVCVLSIPEESGYLLYQSLHTHFPANDNCAYTLKVQTPKVILSDASISNKDFTTMQNISAKTSFSLLDDKKTSVLSNSVSVSSSSAITSNPYASVVAQEKTAHNLYPLLADQIALHVAAYLDRKDQ